MPFLYRTIIDSLLSEIKSGRLRPGDRVATELELAEQFGVSRITAKRAMEELHQMGLVERFRGKGTFITGNRSAASIPYTSELRSLPAARRPQNVTQIGFVAPTLSELFGVVMLEGIDAACRELDIDLTIRFTHGSMNVEIDAIRTWRERGFDGIIVFPVHGEVYNDQLLRAVLDHYPIVLVDRHLVGVSAPSVMTDHYGACFELTSSLVAKGHTSLAFVSPTALGTSSLLDRHRAFLDAVESNDVRTPPRMGYRYFIDAVVPGVMDDNSREQGMESLRQFLHGHADITAIVTSELAIALMLLELLNNDPKLKERNIEIAGFDMQPMFTGMRTLLHVKQDEYEIGRLAVDMMARMINGENVEGRHFVPHRLIQPESSNR